MTIATRIFTKLRGKFVGEDEFGNRYYQDKKPTGKRWVLYKGMAEPSKVPPAWHGWLHYTTDEVLKDAHEWQKAHTPNLTGTKNAYFPPGHEKKGGVRSSTGGDYESWNPDE